MQEFNLEITCRWVA